MRRSRSRSFGGAHPRVCGENEGIAVNMNQVAGSSPRVRGKPRLRAEMGLDPGLIPACAGKTRHRCDRPAGRRAHPRVCGENIDCNNFLFTNSGSSPRVRGKPGLGYTPSIRAGLIPACAGKTRSVGLAVSQQRAHPRVCGENLPPPYTLTLEAGSSPRVRGKRVRVHARVLVFGLIPACAGKTKSYCRTWRLVGAHPRVCGENELERRHLHTIPGSSPRVRGKHCFDNNLSVRSGLIPACAGKTVLITF